MFRKIMDELIGEISRVLADVEEGDTRSFLEGILKTKLRAKKIFVVGAGRSGLAAKAFAMRLMHLGFNVYVVGEIVTPPLQENDLLIAVSGSGKTKTALAVVETAKKKGARIASITSFKDSPIAQLSDCIVKIEGRVKPRQNDYYSNQLMGNHAPLTPMGTLFEISANIFLDSVVSELMVMLEEKEDELKGRHTNLE